MHENNNPSLCYAGESDSDDDSSLRLHRKHASASAAANQNHLSSGEEEEDNTLNGGSYSTAQPLIDADSSAHDSKQPNESQLHGNASRQSQAQSLGQAYPQAQTQAESQSRAQSHAQSSSPVQSLDQYQTQPSFPVTQMQSPFLDRLAAANGHGTSHSNTAPQQAQHAGQDSRHSDAHTQDAAQPAIRNSYPGPDLAPGAASELNQATDNLFTPNQEADAYFKPNKASQSRAQQGADQVSAGAASNEEEGDANYQYETQDPMAGGQTLASNLAFQQELRQRSSQRHGRAEALRRDGGGAQQGAEGGVPGGQEGGQRGQRYDAVAITGTVVPPAC